MNYAAARLLQAGIETLLEHLPVPPLLQLVVLFEVLSSVLEKLADEEGLKTANNVRRDMRIHLEPKEPH